MTLMNVSATAGLVTTRIDSKADIRTGCPDSGVDWIVEGLRRCEFCLHNGYHCGSSLLMLATVPTDSNDSRLELEPEPNRYNGLYHTKSWTIGIGPVLPPRTGITISLLLLQLSI
jgi:hypothetical protein